MPRSAIRGQDRWHSWVPVKLQRHCVLRVPEDLLIKAPTALHIHLKLQRRQERPPRSHVDEWRPRLFLKNWPLAINRSLPPTPKLPLHH
jgi:hypothetical protein